MGETGRTTTKQKHNYGAVYDGTVHYAVLFRPEAALLLVFSASFPPQSSQVSSLLVPSPARKG